MIWTIDQLATHFQKLKQHKQFSNHVLLISKDQNIGKTLLKCLLDYESNAVLAPIHPRLFLLRFLPDWEAQKQHLNDLFLWANLQYSSEQYRFFYVADLEKYSVFFLNRLLKFLEDSPNRVIGLFQTAQLNRILPTVRSRLSIFTINDKPTSFDSSAKDHANWITQFLNLYQQAAWNKMLFLLPANLDNAGFWNWFSTLLFDLMHQIHNPDSTEITKNQPLLFYTINCGWKHYLANCRLSQYHHNQLNGLASWTLFVRQITSFAKQNSLKNY